MNDSHLLIHRSPAKWDFYNTPQPIFWSTELKCWITCDPETIVSILKNRSFSVVDYKHETANISQTLGVDFQATEQFLEHAPLAHEGKHHAALRKEMAVEIRERTEAALAEYSEFCHTRISAIFGTAGRFNAVSELFAPCVFKLMSELSGVHLETNDNVSPTQVFDRSLSVNRRKQINSLIGQINEQAGREFPAEIAGLRAAILVIGSDSLLGSLAESFCYEIARNAAKRLSDIAWDQKIPVTAVPYIERIASKAVEIGTSHIGEHQRVRIYLDVFKSSTAGDTAGIENYFGSGRHVCLGKIVSQKAWQILTAELSQIKKKIKIGKVEYRAADYLFNFPAVIEVDVQNE